MLGLKRVDWTPAEDGHEERITIRAGDNFDSARDVYMSPADARVLRDVLEDVLRRGPGAEWVRSTGHPADCRCPRCYYDGDM